MFQIVFVIFYMVYLQVLYADTYIPLDHNPTVSTISFGSKQTTKLILFQKETAEERILSCSFIDKGNAPISIQIMSSNLQQMYMEEQRPSVMILPIQGPQHIILDMQNMTHQNTVLDLICQLRGSTDRERDISEIYTLHLEQDLSALYQEVTSNHQHVKSRALLNQWQQRHTIIKQAFSAQYLKQIPDSLESKFTDIDACFNNVTIFKKRDSCILQ